MTTLPFDFDIFLRSGSTMKPEIAASVHGRHAVLELGAQHRGEQPGADDVLTLRAQRVREHEVPQLGVALPAAGELRGERRGRPGVHDVVLADEAAGHAALGLVEAGCRRPTTGRRAAGRAWRRSAASNIGSPASSSGYQTGIGTPKKRWRETSQSPVRPLDPVLVADPHEVGVPVDLAAERDQPLAQLLVARAVADVPLARRDDLERLVALLEELHGVGDRPWGRRAGRPSRAAAATTACLAEKTVLPASSA